VLGGFEVISFFLVKLKNQFAIEFARNTSRQAIKKNERKGRRRRS